MIRLFIEDQELDVNQGFSNQITYAVDDLQNLDSKATAFSKTIVLPGSANNNRLLGNIFEFGAANFTVDTGKNVGYNFNASKSAKAKIEYNGLTVIKGVLRLLEIVRDGHLVDYEVAIFGELGGLIANLAGKKLVGNTNNIYDLDFSQYNHQYTIANILSSWDNSFTLFQGNTTYSFLNSSPNFYFGISVIGLNLSAGMQLTFSGTASNNTTYTIADVQEFFNYNNTGFNSTLIRLTTAPVDESQTNYNLKITTSESGRGYVYPLIDYGGASTDKINYDYRTFRPALYVKEYLDKIIQKAGYTYESNFANSNFFKRLIIPNNDLGFVRSDTTTYGSALKTVSQTCAGGPQGFVPVTWNSSSIINFNFTGGTTFTAQNNYNVKVSLIATGSFQFNQLNLPCRLGIYKSTDLLNPIKEVQFDTSQTTTSGNSTFSIAIDVNTSINTGEYFIVQAYVIFFSNNGQPIFSRIIINNATLTIDKYPPGFIDYNLGDSIKINDTMPRNILQKDFFSSIIKMFNLMITEDKFKDRHLIIEPYVDFYDNDRTTYLDWTDKVDLNQVIKIKPMSEVNARYYEFKYKSDTDYYNDLYRKKYNEGYGDRVFDNALEFSKDTQKTEVIFSATPLAGYPTADKVVSTIFKKNNTLEEKTSSNPRILQFKKITGVSAWKIFNIQTNTNYQTGLTSYGYAGHFDDPDAPNADLNFGATKELYFTLVSGALSNNVFNAYYSSYMAEITDKDSRVITATMKLTESDIYNLDFGRYILIEQVLYRLQKIIDYVPGELCKVQLLRVISTNYQ